MSSIRSGTHVITAFASVLFAIVVAAPSNISISFPFAVITIRSRSVRFRLSIVITSTFSDALPKMLLTLSQLSRGMTF